MKQLNDTRRICAYPGCTNFAASKGISKERWVRYFKWCDSHRQGIKKQERLDYVANQPQQGKEE